MSAVEMLVISRQKNTSGTLKEKLGHLQDWERLIGRP